MPTTITIPLPDTVIDAHTPVRTAAQRLRNTLRLNATSSLLGGLTAVIAGGPLHELLGAMSSGWVRAIGAGLTIFALAIVWLAGRSIRHLARWTPAVVAADVTWVVGSVASIIGGWYSIGGGVIVGTVALLVAIFAARQTTSLWSMNSAAARADESVVTEDPPVEVVHASARIAATPANAWTVVSDHELFGRLAPNLSKVTPTGPNSPALSRTCTNRSGGIWSEQCTHWVDGEQFDVAVDTDDYPYPLTDMRGSWWVKPTSPTTVGMDYRYRPQPGIKGRAFAAMMQAAFPVVLRRIVRGWRHEIARRAKVS